MTRILVVGASGMLGHQMTYGLSRDFEVSGTVRGEASSYSGLPHFARAKLVGGVDVERLETIERAIQDAKPDVVINAIGVIKQVAQGNSAIPAIKINALFPHQLAGLSGKAGARFITFGTDCVFSGRGGPYTETDCPDATDFYGRSKLLGEVAAANCLTLRTSIVGRELRGGHSLVEWILSQNGKTVKGFRRALYSGMTTDAAANLVSEIIRKFPDLSGIWQVAGPQISKFDLLGIVRDEMGLDIQIEADDEFCCDRRLDGSRFSAETGLKLPSWREMIASMASQSHLYDYGSANSDMKDNHAY